MQEKFNAIFFSTQAESLSSLQDPISLPLLAANSMQGNNNYMQSNSIGEATELPNIQLSMTFWALLLFGSEKKKPQALLNFCCYIYRFTIFDKIFAWVLYTNQNGFTPTQSAHNICTSGNIHPAHHYSWINTELDSTSTS